MTVGADPILCIRHGAVLSDLDAEGDQYISCQHWSGPRLAWGELVTCLPGSVFGILTGILGGSEAMEIVMSSCVCVKKLKVRMALTLSPNKPFLVLSKVTKLSLSAAAERVQFDAHALRLPCDRKAGSVGVLQAAETAPDSCGEEKIFWCQHEATNANSGVSAASLGSMGLEIPSMPKHPGDLSSGMGQGPIPALQEGCASCHLSFYLCRKEIQSLKQEHKEMSLLLSKIRSLRNMIHDDRICMELKCLLQTKDQYDCLIRDRKALVSELDNEVSASEPLPGSAWYGRAEPWVTGSC